MRKGKNDRYSYHHRSNTENKTKEKAGLRRLYDGTVQLSANKASGLEVRITRKNRIDVELELTGGRWESNGVSNQGAKVKTLQKTGIPSQNNKKNSRRTDTAYFHGLSF